MKNKNYLQNISSTSFFREKRLIFAANAHADNISINLDSRLMPNSAEGADLWKFKREYLKGKVSGYENPTKQAIIPILEEMKSITNLTQALQAHDNINTKYAYAIQCALKALNCDPGPIDTIIGNNTQSAIKKFQKLPTSKGPNGVQLAEDGIVGPNTLYALIEALKLVPAAPAPAPNVAQRAPTAFKVTFDRQGKLVFAWKEDPSVTIKPTVKNKYFIHSNINTIKGAGGSLRFMSQMSINELIVKYGIPASEKQLDFKLVYGGVETPIQVLIPPVVFSWEEMRDVKKYFNTACAKNPALKSFTVQDITGISSVASLPPSNAPNQVINMKFKVKKGTTEAEVPVSLPLGNFPNLYTKLISANHVLLINLLKIVA